MLDGERFIEALSRLGYPNASALKSSEFDWLFDAAPDNLHLLRVFCHRLNRNNALTPEEVQAFRVLRESGKPILDEATLGGLLKTCGPTDVGVTLSSLCAEEDISVEDLEAELQALRKEKQLKLRRLKKLQVLASSRGAESSTALRLLQEGSGAMKDAVSALAVENAAMNAALESLVKETQKLAGFFHTEDLSGGKSNETTAPSACQSVLLSQLLLEPYLHQEEQNTKTLATYTQRQFFQGISDMVETSTSKRFQLTELSSCSESEEVDDEKLVESRRKEMAQLQWAYIVAQHQLLKEQAEEHGDQALKNWLSEQLSAQTQLMGSLQASWREPALHSELLSVQSDLNSLMQETVRSVLRDSARLLNVPVVRGDLALQIARQNYYTARQAEVRDQLLRQKASFDVLRLAQDTELRNGERTVIQLGEVISRLEGMTQSAAQRGRILTQPELTQTHCLGPNAKLQVISSKDVAFSRLLQMLELGKQSECEDPLLTFGRLEAEACSLQEEFVSVHSALERAAQEQGYSGVRLENDRDALERSAYSDIVQPLLRPQVCAIAAPAQELCPNAQAVSVVLCELEEKQKNLYKLLQEVVGDLRTKRARLEQSSTLKRERELTVRKDRVAGEMEYRPCSTLTAGPLSAAAQRVMAALRAQYAGRIDRGLHIAEPCDRSPRAKKQGTFNKTPEPHAQAEILNVSYSYHRDSKVNLPQSDLVENSYNTKPQLHEDRDRHLFKHFPEVVFPSQPDLWQLHDGENTFSQWGADKQGDWRPDVHEDDGSLSGFHSGNNNSAPSRTPSEPEPQGRKIFPRNVFINSGNPQAVIGLPESQIPRKKEGIQMLASSDEICKSAAITRTPPIKRRKFGTLNIPITTCSIQFEEDHVGQKSEVGKINENPKKMPFWSFEKKTTNEKTTVDQNSYRKITEKFELNSILFGGLVKESSCKKVRKNEQNEKGEYSKSLEYQGNLEEMTISQRESQEIGLVLTDSSHDSATNEILNDGSRLPAYHMLVSLRTSDIDQYTVGKEKASAVDTEPTKVQNINYNADLYMHQSDVINDQMEAQEPEIIAAPKFTETQHNQQEFRQTGQRSSGVECVQNLIPSQESCISNPNQTPSVSGDTEVQLIHQAQQGKVTRQFSLKSTLNQDKMPVKAVIPLRERKKQEPKVISDIPKVTQQRHSALEVNDQTHPERPRDEDRTSEITKCTLALTSDPRVCDASRLSQNERMCVLEEAARARALVVTMVYQDGTTQLDPEQKCPPAVCGVLVLLKKSLDLLVLEETAEERLLFLRLEQRPVWAQQDPQHNQDLFAREILLKMVCGTQTVVCYKSKDFLRTALRHFNKDLSWKQVAGSQVLDPQIASWLLDPADSASCFQGLFNKYCTQPTTHTPVQDELRHQKVNHVTFSLSQLHRVMVELRNKLETQGLWQLYSCMEQKMIPLLAAMESHRIHVDKDALKKTSEILGTKMKQLEQEAHQTAGQKFLVSSSSQLRLVLFEKLRLHERCENKKLPKTMLKQQQSTSEAVLLQLQDLHPLPKIVLEYRQVHKIKSTFLDGILSCMTKTFISSTWNQTSTVSGRLSAKHPNFQALPRLPVQISKKQYVEDFCQVELRLLAHLSSDPELLRIFQNPEADVFNMFASQWKGVSEDSVSAEDREHAKRIVYSVVYGAGKERLSTILGVSAEEASRVQDRFLQKYKEVQAFIQCTVQHCHKYGYVKSIMGRRRSLPHIHSTDWGIRNQAERQAVNFVVQGSAADLCKMAMIHICSLVASSTTLTARLVAQIHDELLFEVEDSQVEDFAALVKKTMESLQHISCLGVSLTVPLKVSVSTGRSWGSMCEIGLPHAATTHRSI